MTSPKKNSLEIKQRLYQLCHDFVEERFLNIQNQIKEIQESLTSETKSSAGDKHETGRAMLQLEREKTGHQLAEIEKLKESLFKIDSHSTSDSVGLGSLVYTSRANYFLAISAGLLQVESQSIFAISPNTPIGLLLMGKATGDEIVYKNQRFKIVDVI